MSFTVKLYTEVWLWFMIKTSSGLQLNNLDKAGIAELRATKYNLS